MFEDWTPEKAWFLGVFVGDGNLYAKNGTYRISAAGCESTMTRWASLLSEDVRPMEFKRAPGTYQAYVDSKKLVRWFGEKLGITGPKHDSIPWPKGMPDGCIPHFLRGVWDSDGSLSFEASGQPAAGLAMNADGFVRRVLDVLVKNGATKVSVVEGVGKNTNLRYVKWRSNPAVHVANYLYEDAPESLRNEDRWKIYQQFLEWEKSKFDLCECGAVQQREGKCVKCWYAARPNKTGEGTVCACGKSPILAKGMCTACYNRERRSKSSYVRKSTGTCACGKAAYRKGMCDACYGRDRRKVLSLAK